MCGLSLLCPFWGLGVFLGNNQNLDDRRKLRPWLDPISLGVSQLEGSSDPACTSVNNELIISSAIPICDADGTYKILLEFYAPKGRYIINDGSSNFTYDNVYPIGTPLQFNLLGNYSTSSVDITITGAFNNCTATITTISYGCPTCTDNLQNGDETGIDCGGTDCPPCPPACTPLPSSAPVPLFVSMRTITKYRQALPG